MIEPTRAELEAASALLREVTGFHEHPDDCDGLALCIREAQKRERDRCADIADQHASCEGIAQKIADAIRAGAKEPSDG